MSLKSFLLDLLFPVECLGCGRESAWLCLACSKKLKFGTDHKTLNLTTPFLDRIFIAGDYDDPLLKELIKKFKYHFLASLAEPLGQFLIFFWQGQLALINPLPDKTLLVPMPLAKKRLRWRGFNQAEMLARKLSAAFPYSLCQDLKRKKYSRPQAGLSENERALNIKNSFFWTGDTLNGQTIILLDDVLTTGATLNEAARVLKEAGAARIYALVLAKG